MVTMSLCSERISDTLIRLYCSSKGNEIVNRNILKSKILQTHELAGCVA